MAIYDMVLIFFSTSMNVYFQRLAPKIVPKLNLETK